MDSLMALGSCVSLYPWHRESSPFLAWPHHVTVPSANLRCPTCVFKDLDGATCEGLASSGSLGNSVCPLIQILSVFLFDCSEIHIT